MSRHPCVAISAIRALVYAPNRTLIQYIVDIEFDSLGMLRSLIKSQLVSIQLVVSHVLSEVLLRLVALLEDGAFKNEDDKELELRTKIHELWRILILNRGVDFFLTNSVSPTLSIHEGATVSKSLGHCLSSSCRSYSSCFKFIQYMAIARKMRQLICGMSDVDGLKDWEASIFQCLSLLHRFKRCDDCRIVVAHSRYILDPVLRVTCPISMTQYFSCKSSISVFC